MLPEIRHQSQLWAPGCAATGTSGGRKDSDRRQLLRLGAATGWHSRKAGFGLGHPPPGRRRALPGRAEPCSAQGRAIKGALCSKTAKSLLLEPGRPAGRSLAAEPPRRPPASKQAGIEAGAPAVLHYRSQAAATPNPLPLGWHLRAEFDCSGLVQSALPLPESDRPGMPINRRGTLLSKAWRIPPQPVSLVRPRDLIFFRPTPTRHSMWGCIWATAAICPAQASRALATTAWR